MAARSWTASIGARKLNFQCRASAMAKPNVAAKATRSTRLWAAVSRRTAPIAAAGGSRATSVQIGEIGDQADPDPANGVGQGAALGVDHQARLGADADVPGAGLRIEADPDGEPLRV